MLNIYVTGILKSMDASRDTNDYIRELTHFFIMSIIFIYIMIYVANKKSSQYR